MLLYQEFTHEQEQAIATEALYYELLNKAVKITDRFAYLKNGIKIRYAR